MKQDPTQYRLPFEKPTAEAVAIRSIAWQATGLTEHTWRQVREILIAVLYCGRRDGCYARRETLLQIANDQRDQNCEPIESMRSFERRHREAVKLGLLEVKHRYRKTAWRGIDFSEINRLVTKSRTLAKPVPAAATCAKQTGGSMADQVASDWRVYGGSSGGSTTIPTKNNSPKTINNCSTDEQKNISWEQAEAVARRLVRKLGAPRPADWSLLLKAAALSQNCSEHWLHDAVEGVKLCRAKKPYAYLHRSLERSYQGNFGRSLAALAIPPGLQDWQADGLGKRLCVAGALEDVG